MLYCMYVHQYFYSKGEIEDIFCRVKVLEKYH